MRALDTWLTRLKGRDLNRRESDLTDRYKEATVARSWSLWRSGVVKRRTERWTRDISVREARFFAEREAHLQEITLNVR